MMRIKEAIQRKKLIHELNEEWKDYDFDLPAGASPSLLPPPSPDCLTTKESKTDEETESPLLSFVQYLTGKLNDYQKRALKVTWKRLSEAPKTSGRGTIHIMEKVLNKLCETEPAVTSIFYKSAFLSCIEDRRCGRKRCGSISTIRDHAHILVKFIDAILQCMFEGTNNRDGLDPETVGASHSRLGPLGFDRRMWHALGECFAEVMFMQDCIRAYPHAPSAWSLLAVAMTDKMYAAGKPHSQSSCSSYSSFRQLQRGRSVDAVRIPRISGITGGTGRSSADSGSCSSDEVFVTARNRVEPSVSIHGCPYAKNLSLNQACAQSFDSPTNGPVTLVNVNEPAAPRCAYSPSMRLTVIDEPNDYSNRLHPIQIPRVTMSKSLSELRKMDRLTRVTNV